MISISIIDFIGKMDDGVCVILSMIINDKPYEVLYWFNKNNNYRFVIDEKFYNDFPQIKNIYEYEPLKDLIVYIDHELLPKREEIWKEFGL